MLDVRHGPRARVEDRRATCVLSNEMEIEPTQEIKPQPSVFVWRRDELISNFTPCRHGVPALTLSLLGNHHLPALLRAVISLNFNMSSMPLMTGNLTLGSVLARR